MGGGLQVVIVGYARTSMTDAAFRDFLRKAGCIKGPADEVERFLAHCQYIAGGYDDAAGYAGLNARLTAAEAGMSPATHNRLFYLAVPPSVFVSGSAGISAACFTANGWHRVVVEKPFGHDFDSSQELSRQLARYLKVRRPPWCP